MSVPSERKRAQKRPQPIDVSGSRAVIYCRVSTAVQANDGTSLDSQRRACSREAKARKWAVVAKPYVDAGVSGAKASRPALDEMLALVESGGADVVIISRLDRLGRSLLDLLVLIQRLDQAGARVISVSDSIDTSTAMGRMLVQLLGLIAEYERNRIRERTEEGLRRRAEEGGFVSSTPPYGYRAVPDPGGRGMRLVLDEAQASCIRDMYRLLVSERVPVGRAAETLNAAGHRSGSGRPWTADTLARWARGTSPSRAGGVWTWSDIDVEIPQILTVTEVAAWLAWQSDTSTQQRERGPYLLSGLISTPCGRSYIGRTAGSQAPTYSCRNHLTTKHGEAGRCACLNVSLAAMDDLVWSEVAALISTPAGLGSIARQHTGSGLDIGGDRLGARTAEAVAAVAALRQRIADDYHAALAEGFDSDTARLMVKPLQADFKAVQAEVNRLGRAQAASQRTRGDASRLRSAMSGVQGSLDEMDTDKRRDVLEALAVEVQVTGYSACPSCDGSGYQPVAEGAKRGWPPRCERCARMRQLPVVQIRVTAPEALLGLESLEEVASAG